MNNSFLLYLIIVLGFLARSRVIVLAGFSLLLIKELGLTGLSEFLSDRGIEIGLIFLLMAILAPMILTPMNLEELKNAICSWKGIVAMVAGLVATQFNGMGLQLLEDCPQIIIGIIVGSLIGIVLFGGIPVGPLMAAGIAAVIVQLISLVFGL
ncbi:MAG: DUF441 domain-containing protein [Halanaerobiaceae bacterium]